MWQKVFEYPIARPPIVDGPQMLLIERAAPQPQTLQDTVLAVNPQTGDLQWEITDAKEPVPYVTRNVLGIKFSPKYWLLLIQYVKPTSFPNPNPVQYELVVDRQSGQVIYDSGANASGSVFRMEISDEALFDDYSQGQGVFEGEYMRRIDLPAGTTHWMKQWDSRYSNGLFAVNDWLYNFNYDNVHLYSPVDGTLVKTVSLDIHPSSDDVSLQGKLAIVRSAVLMPKDERVGVFDLQKFSLVWSVAVDYRHNKGSNAFWGEIPTMAVTSNSIYLFDAHDTLFRLDLLSGNIVWQTPSPGPQVMSRPIVIHDLVYGLFADGTVRVFSETDGSPAGVVVRVPIWYLKDSETQRQFLDLVGGLGVSDNTLIITTGCRTVYAIQRAR